MAIDPINVRIALWFGLLKGIILASTTAAIGIAFWQSLIVACISGGIGFLGAIGAAIIAAREAKKNRTVLHDVKRKLGVAHRETDKEEK